MHKIFKLFSVAIAVLFYTFHSTSYAETQTYTLAVVPQFKPAELQKDWGPVLERIFKESGIKLKLNIPTTITAFESELNAGKPDIAYANPYQSVIGFKSQGYNPVLRDSKPLNGILVVNKDSGIKKISDLDGKTIGFPAPNAFGASLYLRARLVQEHSLKFTPKYLNNHNVVFNHVLRGHVAAGGSVNSALNDEPENIRNNLTVLYQTPDVAPHPIIVHPRISEQSRKAIISAFKNMMNDAEGRDLLKHIRMASLTDANYQQDYAPIEKLNINKFLEKED